MGDVTNLIGKRLRGELPRYSGSVALQAQVLVYVLRHFSVVQGDVRVRGSAQSATQDVAHQWRPSVTTQLNAAALEARSGSARFFAEFGDLKARRLQRELPKLDVADSRPVAPLWMAKTAPVSIRYTPK
jgi:hypothetical protein